MIRRREWLYAAGIFGLAAIFRLAELPRIPPGLWYDEARNLWQISAILECGEFRWDFFVGEPLYAIFAIPTCLAVGLTPFGLRLASAAAGMLTIPAAWAALRLIWGRKTALLGALLLAILPWHVIFSRIGFRAITFPLFLFLTLWAFEMCVRRGKRWAQAAFALALGLGFHSYIPFKLMFLILPIYGYFKWRKQPLLFRKMFHPVWSPLATGLLCLLVLPFLMPFGGRADAVNVRIYQEENLSRGMLFTLDGPFANLLKVLGMFIWKGDAIPRHNTPGAAQIPRFLFPFLVIGAALSLRNLKQSRNVLLICSMVFFLLPSVISLSAPHAIRTLGALFPVCVFLARGLRWTHLFLKRRFKGQGLDFAAACFIIFTIIFCGWQYFISYGRHPLVREHFQGIYAETAEYLMRELPADAVIWHEPFAYGRLSFEFLTRKRGARVRTIENADDVARIGEGDTPCYALFIGRERFGGEFLAAYPEAERVRIFKSPDGAPEAVLFRVK
ncbi:MAG TPA: glycosyltransferase family 39 protein [Candidatus Sumerlaeota bacterium]|nr:MAG: hypothetical protein BWY12_00983 [candidate division BRC1 bacterium ADurb.Bin183]HOE63441.1 glycosyltransferase family 39 protein [Candidatus Sumerlaeota bacterium]HRR32019.1 glycosyltransferase family 39 protein [Candidatus Sumerlaeia bacterium]HON50920.1 glycosyltransferase family 39 protein [Candidatus Sumerlaeota bacterium]HOR65614.1 glycosyltransferase family 39 protein [Candidatus Sumerlaeota bacterium]